MKNLSSLLEKFKNIKNPKEDKIKIATIVSKEISKEITEDKISITKNILSIKTDNYLKTEIFLKKEKILEELKVNNFFIKDIR